MISPVEYFEADGALRWDFPKIVEGVDSQMVILVTAQVEDVVYERMSAEFDAEPEFWFLINPNEHLEEP